MVSSVQLPHPIRFHGQYHVALLDADDVVVVDRRPPKLLLMPFVVVDFGEDWKTTDMVDLSLETIPLLQWLPLEKRLFDVAADVRNVVADVDS